jgi:uncharacterized membrane protein
MAPGFKSRFARDKRGSIAIIAAFATTTLIGCAAFAIDTGSVFLESRRLQGIADLTAIAAASNLTDVNTNARATLDANPGGSALSAVVTTGVYTPSPAIPSSQRFAAGGANPNAAKVDVTGKANVYFSTVFTGARQVNVTRHATAAQAQLASFSIGTRLAAVQGGAANALLGALTGSQVSLTVMDYNGLVGAHVDLFDYVNALKTSANLQGVSYNQVLSGSIATGTALQALSNALTTEGQTGPANSVHVLAQAAGTRTQVDLSKLIDLGPYGVQDHVAGASDAKVSLTAMDMAQGVLTLANQDRQVALDFGASVPGLTNLQAWLAIGERPNNSPWMTVSQAGNVIISTAQARLYVQAQAVTGLAGLGVAPITLPVLVEAAPAQAKLSSISCPADPTAQSAGLSVMTSVGTLSIGQIQTNGLNDFKHPLNVQPAVFVQVPLVKATGSAQVNIGGGNWQTVNFSRADITGGVIKTVDTNNIAQATTASLLHNLNLQVSIVGLGLNLGPVTSAVSGTLATIAPVLDQYVDALTNLLGVKLGEADVRVGGLRCHDAALVG